MSGVLASRLNEVSSLPVPITDGGTGATTASGAVDALGGASSTGTGGLVRTTSPTLVTPTLGVAAATSIALGGGTALADYLEGTWAITVALFGGAGNTTPVYSINSGRYTRIGRMVHVAVTLSGDGGDEGAGTGQIGVSLPFAVSASQPTLYFVSGVYHNGAVASPIIIELQPSDSNAYLSYNSVLGVLSPLTGADQNNTTRAIRFAFAYEV